MSDRRLRELERRWLETGAKEDRAVYAGALKRAGLPKLPREVIRHYISEDKHGVVNSAGKISLPKTHANQLLSPCSVELWPRLGAEGYGYSRTMRKNIHFTEDPDDVTCKRCIKSINKPDKRVYKRCHYSPGSRLALDDKINERVVVPVCGRNDSAKFEESFSWTMTGVNCHSCRRIMEQGRRRARRPRMVVPGPLDGLPGGNFAVSR